MDSIILPQLGDFQVKLSTKLKYYFFGQDTAGLIFRQLSIQALFNPYSIAVRINLGNDPAVNPGHGRLFWKF